VKTSFLGKSSNSIKSGLDVLDPIVRNKDLINHGIDIWNVYDFMYLDKNKIPKLKVLEIQIPYQSNLIIESKSMKLYLNQFYKKSFRTDQDLLNIIKNQIEKKIKSKIKIKLLKSFHPEPEYKYLNNSKQKFTSLNTIYKFNGFRSICPVTSQPDFANIYIYTDKKINIDWLNKYLISFKEHGGFHEKCIDEIYMTLENRLNPNHLEICGRFQRRGGIDINPIRGNKKLILFKNFREFNQ
tara:strand:+ start:73 stop:792 length:720 start_codon:yes stop_codon:yes gene_type:complete